MILLRALDKSDLQETLKWHNRKEISDNYLGHPFPVNEEMEKSWYEKILNSNFPTTVFGIEHEQDKKLIGVAVLRNINMVHRSAEFALYIGDETYKGKGLSKIATNKTLKFGFDQLNLHRIYLKVLENNKVAMSLYEKLGFVKEGEFRDSIFKNGVYLNEHVYALLKSEFKYEL